MRLLLDTNVLIWWHLYRDRIGLRALGVIQGASAVYASVVSGLEIAIKKNTGKLELGDRFTDIVLRHRFHRLSLAYDHLPDYESLPLVHKDPFDRMLVAQAMTENLVLVSSDSVLEEYPVLFLNARE